MTEPLTAEEIADFAESCPIWYATVQALRRRAEGAERNRDMYRGFLERQRARIAELVAEVERLSGKVEQESRLANYAHRRWNDDTIRHWRQKRRADMWRDRGAWDGADDANSG